MKRAFGLFIHAKYPTPIANIAVPAKIIETDNRILTSGIIETESSELSTPIMLATNPIISLPRR